MITMPTIVKIAPTRITVMAPHPNGRDVGAREAARAAYREGRAMGEGTSRGRIDLREWIDGPSPHKGFRHVPKRGIHPSRLGTSDHPPSRLIPSGNVLRATEALELVMDFGRKLEEAKNLSDVFELVKRAVEA